MISFQQYFVILCIAMLTACGGKSGVKTDATTATNKQGEPGVTAPNGKGGYYLDDGPGDNAPADIDSIPDAQLKTETPLARTNKPYEALGQKYVPMTSYTPYVKQGIASWYGKRYHEKKTSSGEIYDMYGMTAAHTTLPIPSCVKVTNPANGRSVIVRVNDRGPFKHDRLIDLSYAAAYKLRLTTQGSGLVEVQAIDTSPEALQKIANSRTAGSTKTSTISQGPQAKTAQAAVTNNPTPASVSKNITDTNLSTYYIQVGAFKNELNGDLLQKKIVGLDLGGNAAVTNVYNDGLYRVKLGPFDTRKEADDHASKVRKQLNMSAIVTNQ